MAPIWNFWLPDDDRSAGWTNHCYVLQFVCGGEGDTPAEAWDNLLPDRPLPGAFILEALIAIREDGEVYFDPCQHPASTADATPPNPTEPCPRCGETFPHLHGRIVDPDAGS